MTKSALISHDDLDDIFDLATQDPDSQMFRDNLIMLVFQNRKPNWEQKELIEEYLGYLPEEYK